MKFAVTVLIVFLYCFASSEANAFPEDILNKIKCHDDQITINFSNIVISDIKQNFISSPKITCLSLEHNDIQSIAKGAFDKLPNLTHLYLSYNDINAPDLFNFGTHEKLQVLWLDQATKSPDSTIDIQSSSVHVRESEWCEYCEYRTTTEDNSWFRFETTEYPRRRIYDPEQHQMNNRVLRHLNVYPNLEILSMRQNGLKDLEKETYSQNSRLNHYLLHYKNDDPNRINFNQNTEPKDIFPKLKYLDLSGNGINGSNFVKLLPESLKYLYLNDNSLMSLYLSNLKKLMVLTLNNNILLSINNLLNGLGNLNYLSLSGNKIEQIEQNAFIDTVKLNFLNLSNNNLNFVEPKVWTYLQSLETLDLSHNKFTVFPTFTREMNITVLLLSYNQITSINAANIPKLTELLLNNNKIEEIYTDKFSNLHNLVKLDLSKNQLDFLPTGLTKSLTSLKYLDLSNNQFTFLESLSLTKNMPLLNLYLNMNPLKFFNVQSIENLPQNVTVYFIERSKIQEL